MQGGLVFKKQTGQFLYMAKFVLRGMAVRVLTDSKYIDFNTRVGSAEFVEKDRVRKNLQLAPGKVSLTKCTKTQLQETYRKGIMLLDAIRSGEHDDALLDMVGIIADPVTKLSQANIGNYLKSTLGTMSGRNAHDMM